MDGSGRPGTVYRSMVPVRGSPSSYLADWRVRQENLARASSVGWGRSGSAAEMASRAVSVEGPGGLVADLEAACGRVPDGVHELVLLRAALVVPDASRVAGKLWHGCILAPLVLTARPLPDQV